MRLVTFEGAGGLRVGVQTAQGIVDVRGVVPNVPATLLELLQAGPAALREMQAAVAGVLKDPGGSLVDASARLVAPLPRPGKIFGIALNYRDHAHETGKTVPDVPQVFSKAVTAVVGPGEPIRTGTASTMIDYEGELAVVIGRRAKGVTRAEAPSYLAGYTILNDVTARDVQARSGHCLAKSFDSFAPMGPALVTPDELPDPVHVAIRTTINGETVQDSNTNQLIFSVAVLIEYLSAGTTLEPGDVITTGTPAGVGVGRQPPRFLRAGDVVRIEVAGVGVLENPVV